MRSGCDAKRALRSSASSVPPNGSTPHTTSRAKRSPPISSTNTPLPASDKDQDLLERLRNLRAPKTKAASSSRAALGDGSSIALEELRKIVTAIDDATTSDRSADRRAVFVDSVSVCISRATCVYELELVVRPAHTLSRPQAQEEHGRGNFMFLPRAQMAPLCVPADTCRRRQ